MPNSFDEEVFKMMLEYNDRPIVLPLSNPTSKSECTFEEAYRQERGLAAGRDPWGAGRRHSCRARGASRAAGGEGRCAPNH